jgi:hypothetical protein
MFDMATHDAVIRFQEKYALEILHPSGIFSGTGIAGPSTLKKLNAILGSAFVSDAPTAINSEQTNIIDRIGISNAQQIKQTATNLGFGTGSSERTTPTLGSSASIKRINSFTFTGTALTRGNPDHNTGTITKFVPPLFVYRDLDYSKFIYGYPMLTPTLPYPLTQTPTISFSGVSLSPESGVAQDFSKPVTYTVTARDGSTKDYVVTVKRAVCPNYFPRIPVYGQVTEVVSGIARGWGINPFADRYTVIKLNHVSKTNSPEQQIINKYCNLPEEADLIINENILSNALDGFFIDLTSVTPGMYFRGEVEGIALEVGAVFSTKYSGREYKSGGFSW